MPQSPRDLEKRVTIVGIFVGLSFAAIVGVAMYSNDHTPKQTESNGAIVADQQASNSDETDGQEFRPRHTPIAKSVLITEPSGNPLLSHGFGHLHLAPGVTYANLTVYPILASGAQTNANAKPEFIVLSEGFSNGTTQAVEPRGLTAPAATLAVATPSVTNAQEGDDHRGANLLMVTNVGPAPTYVPDGQVVPGGDQDRGVAADTIIPARTANVAVAAYCVEHGRSSGDRASFGPRVAIAVPSVRYAMQVVGDQQPVWDAVAVATNRQHAAVPSETYNAVLTDEKSQQASEAYSDALLFAAQQSAKQHAVGMVVEINGNIVCADVYRNAALFNSLWPSLMQSYALQAVMQSPSYDSSMEQANSHDAAQWLTLMDSAPGAQSRHADMMSVARVATSLGSGIRTIAITPSKDAQPSLLHEAFFTRHAVL